MCVCVCVSPLSHFCLSVTSWTVAHQVPLSMGFHFLLQRIVPTRFDPGIEPCSIALQRFLTVWATKEAQKIQITELLKWGKNIFEKTFANSAP